MSLFDTSGAEDFRPDITLLQIGGDCREADYLELDEVLSRSGNDLALEADGEGYLQLIEVADFE
jgi:hypothetical protein